MKLKPNSLVLLLSPDNKTYLLKILEGGSFHTHKGIIRFDDMIGIEYGDSIKSSLDSRFVLLEPTIEDMMMKVKRQTQIVYPKDAALILLKSGVKSGSRVIESGIGSGALTIALASAVAPHGKVITYERKDEYIETARLNIEEAGVGDVVEYTVRDAAEGFDEKDIDAVILDLPSPWDGISSAAKSLKGGGRLVSLSPTVNQVEEAAKHMKNEGFVFVETFETIMRHYLVRPGRTRPIDRIVGHTGFLTVGRKANKISMN